ncbi:MAG: helix-turn-helix transcriptional regulator [Leptolyngbyaceae cyanobacterium SL_5_14]|nr:helix-turn-helix transcriptional regulator [Leptolyngbyaceae cyanobacterium SL_5_14]
MLFIQAPPMDIHSIIEGFIDGILILTDQGEVVCTNCCARQICESLSQDDSNSSFAPSRVWRICQLMIDSRTLYPDHIFMIEDEIELGGLDTIRIRVQWIDLESSDRPCLLVALEDRYQSAKKMAIAERQRYGLTDRESEVWLLRRANCTYKTIAAKLHITVDTVKKHIKNIHAKRQDVMWADK